MSWFTKTVEVEVEVEKVVERILVGEPSAVKIYEVYSEKPYAIGFAYGTWRQTEGYYTTCEEAFLAASKGSQVREVNGLVINGKYYVHPSDLKEVAVTKPKVAKGKPAK